MQQDSAAASIEADSPSPGSPAQQRWLRLAGPAAAFGLQAAVSLLRALGPVRASNVAGGLARRIGPLLPVTRRVGERNLRLAMPELDAAARRRILRGVWENLGRTVGEFPHLAGLELNPPGDGPGLLIAPEAADILRDAGGAGAMLLFSGHIGNWEMLPRAAALCGAGFASVYRAASQPAADRVILALRRAALGTLSSDPSAGAGPFAKGATGARQAVAHLRGGRRLGMLVDQKMNDGIQARLFGQPAMTAPALAAMALRFRTPVVGGWIERLGPARLRLHVAPPLALPEASGGGEARAAAILALTQAMNDQLENWIRKRPDSWLWLHRRWSKDLYKIVEIERKFPGVSVT